MSNENNKLIKTRVTEMSKTLITVLPYSQMLSPNSMKHTHMVSQKIGIKISPEPKFSVIIEQKHKTDCSNVTYIKFCK